VRDEQPSHATLNTPLDTDAGDQLSKNPDGNDVRDVQLYHAYVNVVPDEVSSRGKDVREVPRHAKAKSTPDEVSINGKDVRELQPFHAPWKYVTDEVLIAGKDVSEVQIAHAL